MNANIMVIGTKIGQAIARDVIADDLPRVWTGIEPQDGRRTGRREMSAIAAWLFAV